MIKKWVNNIPPWFLIIELLLVCYLLFGLIGYSSIGEYSTGLLIFVIGMSCLVLIHLAAVYFINKNKKKR